MAEGKIATPESIRKENAPDKVYAVTKKYGETVSTLKPGFETRVEKYEDQYEVEAPPEVMGVAKEIYGLGGRALLVGGSVRDAVISAELPEFDLKPKDFDLEVYGLSPQQLRLILETKFGSKNIGLVGEAFEIIKVRIEGWEEPLDVSIPRRESKKGETRREFEISGDPTMTIEEASLRRDLTINSIAYDPLTKTLYDPYGGVEDIKHKRIEITDEKAFQEDELRLMRIMQFEARFEFTPSDRTTALCRQMVERGDLDKLSRDRVREEAVKLFTKGRRPSLGLEFAREIGFLEKYWPEAQALVNVPQEAAWHPEGDTWIHTLQGIDAAAEISDREIKIGRMTEKEKLILVLASLSHDFGKPEKTAKDEDGIYRSKGHEEAGVAPAREFLERIFADPKANQISNITRRVLPLVAEHLKPKLYWENEVKKGLNQDKALRRLARRLYEGGKNYPEGREANIYLLSLVAEADQRGRNGKANTFLPRQEVPELEEWQTWILEKSRGLNVEEKPPEKILTGEIFQKISPQTKPGPWIGAVLNAVYADQLDGNAASLEKAAELGTLYLEAFSQKVQQEASQTGQPERIIWDKIKKLEDPRSYLTA